MKNPQRDASFQASIPTQDTTLRDAQRVRKPTAISSPPTSWITPASTASGTGYVRPIPAK